MPSIGWTSSTNTVELFGFMSEEASSGPQDEGWPNDERPLPQLTGDSRFGRWTELLNGIDRIGIAQQIKLSPMRNGRALLIGRRNLLST